MHLCMCSWPYPGTAVCYGTFFRATNSPIYITTISGTSKRDIPGFIASIFKFTLKLDFQPLSYPDSRTSRNTFLNLGTVSACARVSNPSPQRGGTRDGLTSIRNMRCPKSNRIHCSFRFDEFLSAMNPIVSVGIHLLGPCGGV